MFDSDPSAGPRPLSPGRVRVGLAWLAVVMMAAAAAAPVDASPTTPAADATTLVVEAEAFQYHGGWSTEQSSAMSGRGALWTMAGGASDALTVVTLDRPGTYHVWTRARDYPTQQPGTRRFLLLIDDAPADEESGDHGQEGYHWEKVAVRELPAGLRVLTLRDVTRFFARCDAVLLTTDPAFDPNAVPVAELAAFVVTPTPVAVGGRASFPEHAPWPAGAAATPVARMGNDTLRVTFVRADDAQGQPRVRRQVELRRADGWQTLPLDDAGEALFVLHAPAGRAENGNWFPSWGASVDVIEIEVEGRRYQTSSGQGNPFFAASASLLVPRGARETPDGSVAVTYASADGHEAEGVWSLPPAGGEMRVRVTMPVDRGGDYSVGFKAFSPLPRGQVEQVLLPPLYNYRRLPEQPVMVTSAMTPHPMALVQHADPAGPWGVAVVADPAGLPFEWPKPGSARYGFSLLDEAGRVQPAIFTPVLGMAGSRHEAGGTLDVSWRVLVTPGDWAAALAYSSEHIFGVTDYRRPLEASLTTAAHNMIALLTADGQGWDDHRKGYWNIESPLTVTQASPLTLVNAALLTGDESLYAARALPTIEYMLSRPESHFAIDPPKVERSYVTRETTRVRYPNLFYGPSFWEGLHATLGHANPWMVETAHEVAERRGLRDGFVPAFTELLSLYALDPNASLLQRLVADADAYIARDLHGNHERDLGLAPFYNHGLAPYWWDLLNVYELTGEKRFLEAAVSGAHRTMAGQWVHPGHPSGDLTIHPGDRFPGQSLLWYRGAEPFRLGWPRQAGDTPQRQVPAWRVSPVGLSLEQPTTYFGGGAHGFNMIQMSAFAPHLLRVYQHTGDPLVRAFARNSIIGRFTNYPGYYVNGFTDLHQHPDYPLTGPDVTTVYYHHIPVHLAFTLDWLFTEAQVRSGGRVGFPFVRQHRYVWFHSRLFGHAAGTVFGDDTAEPRLDADLARVNQPEVNHLLARGRDTWWVMLMNDAPVPVTATVGLDLGRQGLRAGQPYDVLDAQGQRTPGGTLGPELSATVPAQGMITLALPADPEDRPAVPPLGQGRLERDLGEAWGTLYAFRIRGPFGKDSLYVFTTGRPEGGVATLQLAGDAAGSRIDNDYPYEFSVYPWAMTEDLSFTLTLQAPGSDTVTTQTLTLPGTPGAGTGAR